MQTNSITVCYGNCSSADCKMLQRIVKTAKTIIGLPLPSIQDTFNTHSLCEGTRHCGRPFPSALCPFGPYNQTPYLLGSSTPCCHCFKSGVFSSKAIFSKICGFFFYQLPNSVYMLYNYINTAQNQNLVARKLKLVETNVRWEMKIKESSFGSKN